MFSLDKLVFSVRKLILFRYYIERVQCAYKRNRWIYSYYRLSYVVSNIVLLYSHTTNVIIFILFSRFSYSHSSKMLTIPINVLFLFHFIPVYNTSTIFISFYSSFASTNAPSSKVSVGLSSVIFQFHYFLMEKKNILNYFLQKKKSKIKQPYCLEMQPSIFANINLL